MTPRRRGNGRWAIVFLVGGSILFFLLLIAWLWPSLRRYRSGATTSLVEPVRARPPLLTDTPAEAAGRPIPSGPLLVAEASEGEGRVRIEPAPFQAPPTRVDAPPPPPGTEAAPPAPPAPGAEAEPASNPAAAEEVSLTVGGDAPTAGAAVTPAPAPVLEPPLVLKAAWLRYPEEARRRRVEGSVEVRILVAETGGVREVELARSAGDTTLDNAALEAARATQFRPAHLGEERVAVWYNYRFVFSVPRS